MKTKPQSPRTIIRQTALSVIFASSIIATVPAQAGWFSHATSKVQHVTAKVVATPGNIEATVKDISAKINAMFQNFEKARPLRNKLQQVKVIDNLKDTLDYLKDSRAGYEDFAANESERFRGDLMNMFSDLAQINQTFLHREAIQSRLDKVNNVVNRLPTSFLYLMHQAIGPQMQEIGDKLALLQTNLAPYANMPRMRDVIQSPRSFSSSICTMQQDHKVRRAVIKVILGQLSVIADAIKDVVPHDLVIEANVVGEGGGLTWSSHPLNWIASVTDLIINMTKEGVDDYETIAEAICPATN